MDRVKEIQKLRGENWSWKAIGVYFGLSRSRVHQLGSGYKCANPIRRKILLKFNNTCQICNKKDDLIMHHIDGNDRKNEENNLTIFCRSCHSSYHLSKEPKTIACKNCNSEYYPKSAGNRYCSDKCKRDFYLISLSCEICGEEFKVRKAYNKLRKSRFCSKKCQGRWLGLNYGTNKNLTINSV